MWPPVRRGGAGGRRRSLPRRHRGARRHASPTTSNQHVSPASQFPLQGCRKKFFSALAGVGVYLPLVGGGLAGRGIASQAVFCLFVFIKCATLHLASSPLTLVAVHQTLHQTRRPCCQARRLDLPLGQARLGLALPTVILDGGAQRRTPGLAGPGQGWGRGGCGSRLGGLGSGRGPAGR